MKKSVLYTIGLATLMAVSGMASAYAIVPEAVSGSDAGSRQKLDFDEDTYMYLHILDATPTGDSYMLWDDWGGTWSDAEKVPGDDGVGNPPPDNPGEEDDLMCWAASASNVLEWTGWGSVSGMVNTDQMFQHFQDHWYDDGSFQDYAWHWWFDGTLPPPDGSYVDVPGGGNFWSTYTFTNYYSEEWTDSQTLATIDNFLHNGQGIGLAIYTDAGGAHAITCWGYNYNPANPTDYYGIWVTDSDDDKHLASPPDRLRYYEVVYDSGESRWHLQDYYGSNNWYIGGVMALRGLAPVELEVDAAVERIICSYDTSVRIPPELQLLQPITVGVYLTEYCGVGGALAQTPTCYFVLPGVNYEIKVPISANGTAEGNWWIALFEHWEVWDQAGTPQLQWIDGINEAYIYTGSWEHGGQVYTRITKLIATPKYNRVIRPEIEHNLEAKYQASQKELLDRSDGILEPYLRFGINNPEDGGDKLLIAVYHLQWGPESEHLYFQTILSPDAALDAFLINDIDAMTDLIRTSDVDSLREDGAVITCTPGFHMCYIASNLRLDWMGPQDGGEPGRSLRQAMAHLLPKDTLIAMLFQYIVGRLDTFVPPSLEEWYNPNVPIYDYDPDLAYQTLVDGGWEYSATLGTWWHPATGAVAGGADGIVQVLSPLFPVAPTSFTIVDRYVLELNTLEDPGGNPTPLHAEQQALDFWTLVIRAFQTRDFEQYFLCWSDLSEDSPYFTFHSSMDQEWMDNSPGIHNDELDLLLEIVEFGMDHDEKVQASRDAQALLAEILPLIPIYSRNYFSAHQPEYYGMVLKPGEGIGNTYTWFNVKGPRESPTYLPPLTQIQGNETIWHLAEHVESYNPAEAGSVYASTVLETMYDGLIGENPYTLRDKPWLAQDWDMTHGVTMTTPNGANMVNGMYIEYILDDRVVEGKVRWHDGEVFNAEDIMFSWQYIWNNELTNYVGFWETLIDIDNPTPNTVVAYWNESSQWLLYDAADTAALFAPQVWGYIDTDGDGLNYLNDGDIEGDISIRTYQPEDHLRSALGAYPAQAAFPWLRQAIGQGPFVLYSASEDGYHSHLFAFDTRSHTTVVPGVHYWKSKSTIIEQKVEMFYHIGDVSLDGIIDTLDLARIALHYMETGPTYPEGDYRGFIQEDVVEDGIINVVDLATAGKNFGKEKEY